jgi:hypothetical protein
MSPNLLNISLLLDVPMNISIIYVALSFSLYTLWSYVLNTDMNMMVELWFILP